MNFIKQKRLYIQSTMRPDDGHRWITSMKLKNKMDPNLSTWSCCQLFSSSDSINSSFKSERMSQTFTRSTSTPLKKKQKTKKLSLRSNKIDQIKESDNKISENQEQLGGNEEQYEAELEAALPSIERCENLSIFGDKHVTVSDLEHFIKNTPKMKDWKKLENFHNEKSPELIEKLNNLDIHITWQLPELHQKSLKNKKTTHFKKIVYTKEESKLLLNRWKEFCKIYNFEPQDYLAFYDNDSRKRVEMKKRFAAFLGRDLPHRTLVSILKRFEYICSKYKTGRFTEREDGILLMLYQERVQNMLSLCERLLNRSVPSLFRRLKVLLQGKGTHLNVVQLVGAVLRATGEMDMKKVQTNSIDWNYVKDIYRRNRNYLIAAWHVKTLPCFYPRAKNPIGRYALQANLVRLLISSNWESWESISWKVLSESCYNINIGFLYAVIRKLIKKHIPSQHWNNLPYCVNQLKKNVLPILEKKQLDDWYLRTLTIEYGHPHLRMRFYNTKKEVTQE